MVAFCLAGYLYKTLIVNVFIRVEPKYTFPLDQEVWTWAQHNFESFLTHQRWNWKQHFSTCGPKVLVSDEAKAYFANHVEYVPELFNQNLAALPNM